MAGDRIVSSSNDAASGAPCPSVRALSKNVASPLAGNTSHDVTP